MSILTDFACSICGEPSTQICTRCTKDACANHLCAKCSRCSDCCTCDVPLVEHSEPQPRTEQPASPAPSTETD